MSGHCPEGVGKVWSVLLGRVYSFWGVRLGAKIRKIGVEKGLRRTPADPGELGCGAGRGGAGKQDGQGWLEIKRLKVPMVRLGGVVGEA